MLIDERKRPQKAMNGEDRGSASMEAVQPKPALKIAIVGCGKMAANHLDKVTRLVPCANIALCDKEIVKAQLLGELFGISTLFDSLERLIEQFRPDVYHIVVPPAAHKQLAIQCMRAGGHVYIEKPICLTTRDFEEIMNTAAASNRLICGGHQKIFERSFSEVKNLIKGGTLGRIIHIHAYDSGPYLEMDDSGESPGWNKILPGGMFLDLLPHIMAVFIELTGDLTLEHSSIRADERNRPAEMHGFLACNPTSTTCSFHISFSTKLFQSYYQIECEKGVIILNHRNKFWYVIKKSRLPELIDRAIVNYSAGFRLAMANTRSNLSLATGKYDPYEGNGVLIERFYDAVRNGEESPTPLSALRRNVHLCEQAVLACSNDAGLDLSPASKVEAPYIAHAEALVTGAGGFIGRHLVKRLLEEGKRVRAVVRRPVASDFFGPDLNQNLQVIVGDLTDRNFVALACSEVETVYHLAAATKGDLFGQVESTCVGLNHLLRVVKESRVHNLIYVSSLSVLDQTKFPRYGTVDDSFPTEPYPIKRGAYTYSKLRAEEMVRAFAAQHGVNTVILRPGIVWGPGKEQIFPEFHFQLGARLVVAFGRASKPLPLVYVENLIDALILAGNAKLSDSQPITIVDSDSPSQRRYLRLMGKLAGKRRWGLFIPVSCAMPVFWVAQKALGLMLRKRVELCYRIKTQHISSRFSNQRAQAVLGWKSKILFPDALTRYLEWSASKATQRDIKPSPVSPQMPVPNR